MKRSKAVALFLFMPTIALSAAVSRSVSGAAGQPAAGAGLQVVEPVSILILGAGLIILGLYAKSRRAK